MKSYRSKLKFIILISVLFPTVVLPTTLNLLKNDFRQETAISITKIPKLSAETEWVPNGNVICNEPHTQLDQQICSDGSGGAIITWLDSRDTGAGDIYTQRIDANGNLLWTPNGTAITTFNVGIANNIDICSDGFGGAIIVWEEYTDLTTEYDIYAQRIDASGSPLWDPNGTAICTEITFQRDAKVCSDGQGGGIISWEDARNGPSDIYAQRINATGDMQWTANGTAICTKGDIQDHNQIISDGEGGAIMTWMNGPMGDIYAQKINTAGSTLWTPNGTAICFDGDPSKPQSRPQLCTDGFGGAIITWQDYRNGDYDIFIQRIHSNGIVQWTPNGVAICTGGADQVYPQICSDGVDGAIITWQDDQIGGDQYRNIFAQRVNLLGIPDWTLNGIAICDADDKQENPQIHSDGSGGAIITWEDFRTGNYDIYAQKVDSNGLIKWDTNGTAVSTADNGQLTPQLCSDGLGGAIITWSDYKNPLSLADIYSLRVDDIPYSNHPADFNTLKEGTEILSWIIYDDTSGGKYRVIANDTNGDFYIWVSWTTWDNNTLLNLAINRTELGIFSYSLEYYDELNQVGIPDTIIVSIKTPSSTKTIPLGHYYLFFIILGVLSLILIKKSQFKKK